MQNKPVICILIVFVILSVTIKRSFCQDNEIPKETYQASTIPDSLLKHANSVVRYSEIIIAIKGPGKATIKFHTIVTVLNEKANLLTGIAMDYDKKYDTYSGIELGVFDSKGVLVKKYHKSDMYDGSAANNETMVTDERFLALKPAITAYPVTIEKEYEEDRNSFIDLGDWIVQQATQAVQYSVVKVIVSPSVGFRYKTLNIEAEPVKETRAGLNYYTWTFNSLKVLRRTENIPAWKIFPEIEMAVNSFSCYGYAGDFSSWQSFGNWIYALNSDVSALSPQHSAAIRKMTDSIKTEKGKAKFLYNYLQQNVRYVSIQLGIGGYKPLSADFVDEKKYGDCKALSNYMRALLKAVNIQSDYVFITGGTNARPVDPSFPRNTFNHAILCVPFKNDTAWLECTSNTQPFGKLGSFTENRTALLISDDGGKLVNTPGGAITDNQFNSNVIITLDAAGGAKAGIKIMTTGAYRSAYIRYSALSLDKQKEGFTRLLNMRQPSNFTITPFADNDGIKELNFDLSYDKFCDIISGDKLFLRPSAFDLCTYNVPVEKNRKTDFHFEFPVKKSSVTTILLPAGFEVESMPANADLKFIYGSYQISYVYDPTKNQVTSTAKFNITSADVPPEHYTEMQQFLDAVAREQRKKLVIRRKG